MKQHPKSQNRMQNDPPSGKDRPEGKKAEAIMRLILENSQDAIVTIDEQGLIVSFNPSAEKLFGYGEAEVVGRNVSLLMPEPHRANHDAYIEAYLKTGVAKIIGKGREVTGLRKDGTLFPLFLTIGRGKPDEDQRYFVGMIRDLSHQKNIEAQLRQAHKMESLGTLAGGIAHDFNNILGGILGYVELMLEDVEKDSYQAEDLREMMRGCQRAKSLIQQILTFSRQDRPERQPMYLHDVVEESLKLMRATLPTTIEIHRKIENNCKPIYGNPTQIHQVMMNLCTNAGHAMMEKGGVLEVSLKQRVLDAKNTPSHRQLPFGEYLELVVRDNGCGMEEDVQTRAFDPFFTTKPTGEGSGMGLAVVHGIVQNHDGGITLESEPGRGTRISIYFPVWREPVSREEKSASRPDAGRERILLVDDDRFLLKIQERILVRLGYEVTAYDSANDALAAFRANPARFQLMITDQTMPKMTGSDLALELRASRPDLPMLLTTGFSEAISAEEAEAIGFSDVLLKPVEKNDLAIAVRRALGINKQ